MKELERKIKICFAASTGGHFEQLLMLKPLMEKYDSFIVTEKTNYKVKQNSIKTYYVKQINRKEFLFPLKILINSLISIIIYIKEKPDYIITTGVLSVIPIAMIMKCFRKKIIYIESFAKISSPTKTGKFLYKYADRFYVQWKQMLEFYPKAIYKGGIY